MVARPAANGRVPQGRAHHGLRTGRNRVSSRMEGVRRLVGGHYTAEKAYDLTTRLFASHKERLTTPLFAPASVSVLSWTSNERLFDLRLILHRVTAPKTSGSQAAGQKARCSAVAEGPAKPPDEHRYAKRLSRRHSGPFCLSRTFGSALLDVFRVGGNLQRPLFVEVVMAGQPDLAERAAAELADEDVRANELIGLKRHPVLPQDSAGLGGGSQGSGGGRGGSCMSDGHTARIRRRESRERRGTRGEGKSDRV